MMSAHNVGIVAFGTVLLVLGSPLFALLGALLVAYGAGHSIKEYSVHNHSKQKRTRIMGTRK